MLPNSLSLLYRVLSSTLSCPDPSLSAENRLARVKAAPAMPPASTVTVCKPNRHYRCKSGHEKPEQALQSHIEPQRYPKLAQSDAGPDLPSTTTSLLLIISPGGKEHGVAKCFPFHKLIAFLTLPGPQEAFLLDHQPAKGGSALW